MATFRKTVFAAAMAAFALSATAGDIVTLDLTNPLTPLQFDAETGAWTETLNEDEYTIDSQVFSFMHNAMASWGTWWGFTASNSANRGKTNFLTYQYSNMAKGGIVLDENGKVKLDDFGAPVTSADVPYMVSYASSMMAQRPAEIYFNDGLVYAPQGVYLNLTTWPCSSVENGDGFSRAFTEGDCLKVIIHGTGVDDSDRQVEAVLASFTNGDLTVSRGWKYVDLTPLGEVQDMWFSMSTTDVGNYGDNTPTYFALDKLQVRKAESVEARALEAAANAIRYDRQQNVVTISNGDFAALYDTDGRLVMSSELSEGQRSFSIDHLDRGIYIVKCAAGQRKIVR